MAGELVLELSIEVRLVGDDANLLDARVGYAGDFRDRLPSKNVPSLVDPFFKARLLRVGSMMKFLWVGAGIFTAIVWTLVAVLHLYTVGRVHISKLKVCL